MNLGVALRVAIVVLAAGAVGAIVYSRSRRTEPSHAATAAPGVDWATGGQDALRTAPEGATPCESAYNAVQASLQASSKTGRSAVVKWVAPKDQFLAACNSLSPDAQRCAVPRYATDHRDECERLKPSPETLKAMYVPTSPSM